MLVKNGKICLTPNGNNTRQIKTTSGDNLNISSSNYNYVTSNLHIKIGNGTTQPTDADYNIEDVITSGLTLTLVSKSTSASILYDNPPSILFANYLVTNETENDISVSEIALFSNTAQTPSDINEFLISRTVLADPIVLESGKTYQLRVDVN